MAALNTQTQIPTAINTVESLAAWSILLLVFLFKNKTVLESDGGTIPIVQSGIVRAADGTQRLLIRASLELEEDFITDAAPLWSNVKEIENAALPPAYLRQ